ncbi:hypothetical protein [Bacillus safensis]|uniref:hypothetical protein n=1 Tax=Bacillus safensis TaxID=561879 RepID=UPI0022AB81AE|nr:hypothetical protein [Bacillus safensis]WAT81443.1 hypothetical protein O0R49_03470 [Bacillus safensis]
MRSDLLKDELQKLQIDYRIVLENALEKIYIKDSKAVVDEINIFWFKNKKLVECILNYLHEPYTAYVFTAATILDIENYEHYPFVSLGQYHFWDDPIYKYSEIESNTDNISFGEQMRQQVISTIKDNIQILDNARNIIYILPIRLFTNYDANVIHRAAQQAFLSLFKNNLDFDTYRNNFKTISDIKKGLITGIESIIIFSEDDDLSLDFETRFKNYRATTIFPLSINSSDAEIFWFGVYGYLAQAFDIILMCLEYKLNPYIRFRVALQYIVNLSGNFGENQELKNLVFKCIIAHTLHYTFDKKRIYDGNLKKYYQEIQNYNFENQVFSDLQIEKISIDNPSLDKMISIINKNLEKVLTKCIEIDE